MLLANSGLLAGVSPEVIQQPMKMPRVHWRQVSLAMVLLGIGMVLPACSKQGKPIMSAASFSSAPPELKEKWSAATEYAAHKNYLGAATNLMDIFSQAQQLTPEQNDALTQAWMTLGNQAFEAANKGDKAATEAVLKMKQSGIGERRGRQ
jgi:hypothetical protein